MVGHNPWFVICDFNTTRFVNEKIGGNMMYDNAMTDFHECLFKLELADIPFLGPIFTWMNRREGVNFIARKLDRCLQNECCLDVFPNVMTEVLQPGLSDHCPLVTRLNLRQDSGRRKLYPFKFSNFWADHPTFLQLVKDAWNCEVFGTPMYRLTRKLTSVKAALKAFNFHSFAKLHDRVVDAKENLKQAQFALLNYPYDTLLVENEKKCLKAFHDLACAEEGFLKQKSRIQWLKLGDQNTSFFHKAIKSRNARNSIKVLTLASRGRIEDPEDIKQEAIAHFQNILCCDGPFTDHNHYLDNQEGFTWSPQHKESLNRRITQEEIKNAKAPGLDGFTSLFFKKAWSIVGSDVTEAVESFFNSGCMLREINCTIIALVPKVPNPESMHDYRPISCCNMIYKIYPKKKKMIYKCISKIIASRIKMCLPDIINSSQSAVHGRSIADNVLITQDLMHNYHRNNGRPRCALKIDIKKAYDTIGWSCIIDILSKLGTPANILKCIKACITTPSFSVAVNGELAGFFASKRGLRQGDPLSPLLFIIVMEAFSRSLYVAAQAPNFEFHPKCEEIKLTHISF